jgi:hypothetical protein
VSLEADAVPSRRGQALATLRLHARSAALPIAVWVSSVVLTDRSSGSEHPNGVLINEAVKRWLPELYEQWLKARARWKEWRQLHWPQDLGEFLKKYASEKSPPLLVAAEKAEQALIEACREKLIAYEWIATGMRGGPDGARAPIDGDFFAKALIKIDGSGRTNSGEFRNAVEIYGLRVRRVAASEKRHPQFPALIEYSPVAIPSQFTDWAKQQQANGELVTQGAAWETMKRILDPAPSRKVVRAWVNSLSEFQRAVRGESRKKRKRGD